MSEVEDRMAVLRVEHQETKAANVELVKRRNAMQVCTEWRRMDALDGDGGSLRHSACPWSCSYHSATKLCSERAWFSSQQAPDS
jgi:hypothetical protein